MTQRFDQRLGRGGKPHSAFVMVRLHDPYLSQQRRRSFVRMVVPADVRDIIGQSIFEARTGHTDEHQAATVAAAIVADLQAQIRSAREARKRLEQVTAENLAERCRTERLADPEKLRSPGSRT